MNYQQVFQNTYAGKKVLVTGHTGFKGSWLITWLHRLGAKVKGYALAPGDDKELYSLLKGNELCDSVISDIRDQASLIREVKNFDPDFIFHLAAQSLVRVSYAYPAETFDINVRGTIHLLEAARMLNKPCTIIVVTTDKVYQNRETDHAYEEEDALGGYDPYSASKAAAEIVVSSYRDSFFNPSAHTQHQISIATARAGNVIGGGDMARDRIIPDIVRSMEKNTAIPVRNPGSTRPWQHVLEPLSGYLLLGSKLKDNPKLAGAWNFGPEADDVLTVEELVKQALEKWGKGSYEIAKLTDQPHEAGQLRLNINKAKQQLDRRPRLRSAAAISLTIDWYKHASPGFLDYTTKQIASYEAMVI
ncbi:MAG TPA: CDP-glucose 4,6-dehydratase [Chitinophagaceae bacterium]|nr:CDP-glucose 4,6-dehydratase [Chitinophagaceae bacterium]